MIVFLAGFLSFGKNTPNLIIVRRPLPGSNDIPFIIVQVGIVFGMIVNIYIRITSFVQNGVAFFGKSEQEVPQKEPEKEPLIDSANEKAKEPVKQTINRPVLNSILIVILPFIGSLLISPDFKPMISFFLSLTCPYFMFIAPGEMISADESQAQKGTQAEEQGVQFYDVVSDRDDCDSVDITQRKFLLRFLELFA